MPSTQPTRSWISQCHLKGEDPGFSVRGRGLQHKIWIKFSKKLRDVEKYLILWRHAHGHTTPTKSANHDILFNILLKFLNFKSTLNVSFYNNSLLFAYKIPQTVFTFGVNSKSDFKYHKVRYTNVCTSMILKLTIKSVPPLHLLLIFLYTYQESKYYLEST